VFSLANKSWNSVVGLSMLSPQNKVLFSCHCYAAKPVEVSGICLKDSKKISFSDFKLDSQFM